MGISCIFKGNVTQRNYLNSMSDIEVDMHGGNESVSYL